MYVSSRQDDYFIRILTNSSVSISFYSCTLDTLILKKKERKEKKESAKKKDVHLFHPHHHHSLTRTTKTRNHRPRRQNHSDARNPNHDNYTRLSDNDIDMDIVIRGRIDIITSSHSACTCIWTWDISYYNGNFYSRNI